MTIKEKVKRAFEMQCPVSVLEDGDWCGGTIASYDSSGFYFYGEMYSNGNGDERQALQARVDLGTVTDIRFVDEPEEEEGDTVESSLCRKIEQQCEYIEKLEAERAELKRSLCEPVTAGSECGRDVQADVEMFRVQLNHALAFGYVVEVGWENPRGDTDGRRGIVTDIYEDAIRFGDGLNVTLDAIRRVEIVYVDPKADQPEPHDIAKERWMVYKGVCGIEVRHKCDGHEPSLAIARYGTIDTNAKLVATDAQIELMAAAPGLADIARDVVEEYGHFKGTTSASTKIVELIWRLRDAGIPVAEWYKGGRNTPPYDKIYHEVTDAPTD